MSHIRMSHVTHMSESRHTYECVTSHICAFPCRLLYVSHCSITHTNESCHTYEFSHVTHMDESCHTYGWVKPHIRMRKESCHTHVPSLWVSHCGITHKKESCRTYEWVMSHIWMSHVTHMNGHVTNMNESCRTYEWVMSHIWMSHVTHTNVHVTNMNEFCHTYEHVMSHIWTSHVTQMHGQVTHMNHVTHVNASCHTHVSTYKRQFVTTGMPALNTYTQIHVTRINTSHTNWAINEGNDVTRMFESCHMHVSTSKKAALIWMNHVTQTNGHVTQMNSCHRYEGIMSHTWRHVTHMCPSAKRQ